MKGIHKWKKAVAWTLTAAMLLGNSSVMALAEETAVQETSETLALETEALAQDSLGEDSGEGGSGEQTADAPSEDAQSEDGGASAESESASQEAAGESQDAENTELAQSEVSVEEEIQDEADAENAAADDVLSAAVEEDIIVDEILTLSEDGTFVLEETADAEDAAEMNSADEETGDGTDSEDESYYYYFNWSYPEGTDCLLVGEMMDIGVSMNCEYWDENGDYHNDRVEDFTLRVVTDENSEEAYDNSVIDVSINEHTLHITAKSEGDTNITLYAVLNNGTDDVEVCSDNISIRVSSSYYNLLPVSVENVALGETLDLNEIDWSLIHYEKKEDGTITTIEEEIDGENVRLRLANYEKSYWEKADAAAGDGSETGDAASGDGSETGDAAAGDGSETGNGSETGDAAEENGGDSDAAEEDLLPSLVRTGNNSAWVTVRAEERQIDEDGNPVLNEDGNEIWDELASRTLWFDYLDYWTDMECSYGRNEASRVFTDTPLILTMVQNENSPNKLPEGYTVEWEVNQYDENNNKIEDISCVTWETNKQTPDSITLTANPGENDENIGQNVQVCATVYYKGNPISFTDKWVEVCNPQYDYQIPNSEPGERDILPGENLYISSEMWCYVMDSRYPGGCNVQTQITDVEILGQYTWNENGEEILTNEDIVTLETNEDDEGNIYGWNISGEQNGFVTLKLTYVSLESSDGESEPAYLTYGDGEGEELRVSVCGDVYKLSWEYPNDSQCMLPNSEMTVSTSLIRRYRDEETDQIMEEPISDYWLEIDTGSLDSNTLKSAVVWDAETGAESKSGKCVKLTSKDWEGDNSVFIHVYRPNEDEDGTPIVDDQGDEIKWEVCCSNLYFSVWSEYCYLGPLRLTDESGEAYNVMIGKTLDLNQFKPVVYRVSSDSEDTSVVTDNIRYRIEYDENAWEETESDSGEAAAYGIPLLKRVGNWDTTVNLIAEQPEFNEDGSIATDEDGNEIWYEICRREYQFDEFDFDTWFENLRGDNDTWVFNDEDLTLELNKDNLEEKNVEVLWTLGEWDEASESIANPLDAASGYYTVSEDGFSVILHGDKLSELYNEENENTRFDVDATVYVNGIEVSGTGIGVEVCAPYYSGPFPDDGESLNRLPYWDIGFDSVFECYVENKLYPHGENFSARVTDVLLENDPDENDEWDIDAVTAEHWTDEENENDGWTLHLNRAGHATATITFEVSYEDEGGKSTGTETVSNTFDIWIGGDVFDMGIYSDTGTDQLLNGNSMNLIADVSWGRYDGEHHFSGDTSQIAVEWTVTEGADAVTWTQDAEDSKCLAVTAKEDLDELVDVRIEARGYLLNEEGTYVEEDEVCYADYRIRISQKYYQLKLEDAAGNDALEALETLDVGGSLTVTPVLYRYVFDGSGGEDAEGTEDTGADGNEDTSGSGVDTEQDTAGGSEPEIVTADEYYWRDGWDTNALLIEEVSADTGNDGDGNDEQTSDGVGDEGNGDGEQTGDGAGDDGNEDSSQTVSYKITKLENWYTYAELVAYFDDDEASLGINFQEINYDVSLRNNDDGDWDLRGGDHSWIYNDEEMTLSLDAENLLDGDGNLRKGITVQWTVGTWDDGNQQIDLDSVLAPDDSGAEDGSSGADDGSSGTDDGSSENGAADGTDTESGYYSISDDGCSITLHGAKLEELYNDSVRGSWFHVDATVLVNGNEVSGAGTGVEVKEPYTELEDQSSDTIYPGGGFIYENGLISYYVQNKDHPRGEEYSLTLTDIMVETISEDESEEPTEVLSVEKDTETGTWTVTGVKPGRAEVTYTVTSDELGSKEFTLVKTVIGEGYSLSIDTDTGTNCLLPGSSLTLIPTVYHLVYDADLGRTVRTPLETGYQVSYYVSDDSGRLSTVNLSGKVTANEDVTVNTAGSGWIHVNVSIQQENAAPYPIDDDIELYVVTRYYTVKTDTVYVEEGGSFTIADAAPQLWRYTIKNPDGVLLDAEMHFENPGDSLTIGEDGSSVSVASEALRDGVQSGATGLTVVAEDADGARWDGWCTVMVCCGHEKDPDTQEITKAPTCTETGEKTFLCRNCGMTMTETMDAAGHSYSEEYTVDTAATCTAAGSKSRHCTVCGAQTDITAIPALGHTGGTATCTSGAACARCGLVYGAASGHTWGEWTTVTEATVFAAATQTRRCSVCGASETRETGAKLQSTIALNAVSVPLKVKQSTAKVKVTDMAEGDYVESWTSSNTKIVKVTGNADGTCKITAQKKTGKATITVTMAGGATKTITVKVQKAVVKTKSVKLAAKKVTLKKGETLTLEPIVNPITSPDKVSYTTSNKKVAKVTAKGKITAVKAGTAKITVKVGAKKVVCTVKVTE